MRITRRWMAMVLAIVLLFSLMSTASAENAVTFPDVNPDDWFYDYVMDMVAMGAVSGLPDGTFAPNRPITTGEIVSLALDLMPGKKPDQQEMQSIRNTPGAPDFSKYWAGDKVVEALATRDLKNYATKDLSFWSGTVDRITTIALIYHIYNNSDNVVGDPDTSYKPYSMIGDVGLMKADDNCFYVYWAYSNGIVTGVNARGDFNPYGTLTRSEACGILYNVIHPEARAKVDWDHLAELDAVWEDPSALHRLPDGVDCFSNVRIHYAEDAAYDYCRALEEKIGIPIYYLPEFTYKDAAPLTPEMLSSVPIHKLYFDDILTELHWMDLAYSMLPEGMIKEVANTKYHKNTEIILTKYNLYPGVSQFGCYNYDYSDDPVKVDQIYYTGTGDIHFYLHELGHMITGSMGGTAFNNEWEKLYQQTKSFVSDYAASGNLEDIADTWAYLWLAPDDMVNAVKQNQEPMLIQKIQLLTDMLDKKLETFDAASAPWAEILS